MKRLENLLIVVAALGFLDAASALDHEYGADARASSMELPEADDAAVPHYSKSYRLANAAGVAMVEVGPSALVVTTGAIGGYPAKPSLGAAFAAPAAATRPPDATRDETPQPAAQDPAGLAMLVCGLAVAAFVAWRRTRWIGN